MDYFQMCDAIYASRNVVPVVGTPILDADGRIIGISISVSDFPADITSKMQVTASVPLPHRP